MGISWMMRVLCFQNRSSWKRDLQIFIL
jgi:hypothetical protein